MEDQAADFFLFISSNDSLTLAEKKYDLIKVLLDHHLVNVHFLSEAFGGARIWVFNIKTTDGAKIFAYLGQDGKFE